MERWFAALEARHLSELTFAEVRRALQALSALYVGRSRIAAGAALDGAGKRAAFALFYGPLHFLTVRQIVRALDAADRPPRALVDLGCGTGAAGAAWAIACDAAPDRPRAGIDLVGVDRSSWALGEALWSWRTLGLRCRTLRADAAGARLPGGGGAVLAAYLLNELSSEARGRLVERLLVAAGRGCRVLVVEPIARRATPWWPAVRSRVIAAGGRADEWRFEIELPGALGRLDRASGLAHDELTARSLYLPGRSASDPSVS